jgi:hypothetical protein
MILVVSHISTPILQWSVLLLSRPFEFPPPPRLLLYSMTAFNNFVIVSTNTRIPQIIDYNEWCPFSKPYNLE